MARLRYADLSTLSHALTPRCQIFVAEQVMSTSKHPSPKSPSEHPSSDERLDEALEESFPASDPIAVDPDDDDEDDRTGKQKKSR